MKLRRILSFTLALTLLLSLSIVSASAASVTYQGENYSYDDAYAENECFMTNLAILLEAAEEQNFSQSMFWDFFVEERNLAYYNTETLVYYIDGICYRLYDFELQIPGLQEAYCDLIERYERGEIDSTEFSERYSELRFAASEADASLQHEEFLKNRGYLPAEVEFDAETGTVLKVLNDASKLYIPTCIDGRYVTSIAAGAITGKQQLVALVLPRTVGIIDSVILRDCPKLRTLSEEAYFLTNPSQNCPCLTLGGSEAYTTAANYQYLDYSLGQYRQSELSKCFAVSSGTLRGDGSSYNWDGGLTRAEAITIIIRLMGLDEEAQAKASEPAAFPDVSGHWAVGYTNLAYELGVTRGDGNGKFNPQGLCTAQDFLTMLFRLTQLTEGTDYSWSSITKDFRKAASQVDSIDRIAALDPTDGVCAAPLALRAEASACSILDYLSRGGTFTRLTAADMIFYMMNIVAGDNYRSLADILAVDYGLNDISIYHNFIRRTAYGLSEDRPAEYYDIDYAYIHYYLSDEHIAKLEAAASDTLPEFGFSQANDVFIELYHGKNFEEFTALALELTKNCKTEYEKAETISRWIAEHIFYDYDHCNGITLGVTDAESVLRERRSVCEGYANLTLAMLQAVGIKAAREVGASNSSDWVGHGWNVAKLDGKWVVMDNTWDSRLEYRNGTFYCRDSSNYELIEVENYLDPDTTWDRRYFDSDFDSFYRSHTVLRSPSMKLDPK